MATFAYRGELTRRELLPAVGAGAGAGVVAAYLVQPMLRERTPAERPEAAARRGGPHLARGAAR